MSDELITTGVDDLLALLKSVDKLPLAEAAGKLGISASLVQSWVDFLVEEEIIGVEYKFTKPIIYLNKMPQPTEAIVDEDSSLTIEHYREEFKRHAVEKNIPQDKVVFFWKNHVRDAANAKKELFFREAKKRNLANAEQLWNRFVEDLAAD